MTGTEEGWNRLRSITYSLYEIFLSFFDFGSKNWLTYDESLMEKPKILLVNNNFISEIKSMQLFY